MSNVLNAVVNAIFCQLSECKSYSFMVEVVEEKNRVNYMRTIPFYLLDVFTDEPFGGNPLAVFPDCDQIKEEEFQLIAREMNLSETVFVFPPSKEPALKKLRIFTPAKELPLAGHPVVGAWYALAAKGHVDFARAHEEKQAYVIEQDGGVEKIVFQHELNVGILPVTVFKLKDDISGVVMDQDKPVVGPEITDVEPIAQCLGHTKAAITSSFSLPRTSSTGLKVLVVPLANRNQLSNIELDPLKAAEIINKYEVEGIYAYTRDATVDTEQAFVSARGFFPTLGILEDPATGSAAGCLGAYLVETGIIAGKKVAAFQIEQGMDMGRPSRIGVEVTKADGAIERVRVGGSSVILSESEFYLP